MAFKPPQVQIQTPSFSGHVTIPNFPDYSGAVATILTQAMKQRAAKEAAEMKKQAFSKVRDLLGKTKVPDRWVRPIEYDKLYGPLWNGDETETHENLVAVGKSKGLSNPEADVFAKSLLMKRQVRVYPSEVMADAYNALIQAGAEHQEATKFLDYTTSGGFMGESDLRKDMEDEARAIWGNVFSRKSGDSQVNVNTRPPVPTIPGNDSFVLTGGAGKLYQDIFDQFSPKGPKTLLLENARGLVRKVGDKFKVESFYNSAGDSYEADDIKLLEQVVNSPAGKYISEAQVAMGGMRTSMSDIDQWHSQQLRTAAQADIQRQQAENDFLYFTTKAEREEEAAKQTAAQNAGTPSKPSGPSPPPSWQTKPQSEWNAIDKALYEREMKLKQRSVLGTPTGADLLMQAIGSSSGGQDYSEQDMKQLEDYFKNDLFGGG